MFGTDEPLYTLLAVTTMTSSNRNSSYDHNYANGSSDEDDDELIVACVVGSFVKAHSLSGSTQSLLVNCTDTHPRLFYIMTLGCREEYRGSGLGTFMIQQCMEQVMSDRGCGVLYLHVLVQNITAVGMYEKLGFYRVQEIPGYYKIRDEPHNCYLYAKYYHGNRGHRAIFKLVAAALAAVWQHVVRATALLDILLVGYQPFTTAAAALLSSASSPSSSSDRRRDR